MKIKDASISYTHQNTLLEGFVAYSTDKKRPLVLLCHSWRGRDDFICEKAKVIASLGYVGFAIDMYGKGVLSKSNEESVILKKPFIDDRSLLLKRLLRGFETASQLPYADSTRIAVLGFGFGGLCALDLARSGVDLKGAISVYGHFNSPDFLVQTIKAKILILHGFNDPISPMSELMDFQQEMENAHVDWQTHIYGNTYHAFATPSANDSSKGIIYNPTSAERAWNEIKNFLEELFF